MTASLKVRTNAFFQLAVYARDVFKAQPTRRFVHGFLLLGNTLEPHVFDRAGTYCAEPIDYLKNPEHFIRVLSGYALMSDEELGLDTLIKREGERQFVTLANETTGKEQQFELEARPIARQNGIACRGTSCYLTADKKHVIKFSWPSDERTPEADYLKSAATKGLKGVARLIGHKQISSVADMRGGLRFTTKRLMRGDVRLTDQGSQGAKRKPGDAAVGPAAKRARSNTRGLKLKQEYRSDDDSQKTKTDAPEPSEHKFTNRILTCLAISPAGRPLRKFKTVLELLRTFRDAIKAHQLLFCKCNTLHHDISPSNIIITDPEEADGFYGMLIDMDLATKVKEDGTSECSEAQQMTGTLQFMAVEVLQMALPQANPRLEFTYRHDLESFFYVFLHICTNYGWPKGQTPRSNRLRRWYTGGSFEEIAMIKRGSMEQQGFGIIVLSKFSPGFECLKGLASTLRDVLFNKGVLYTGTPAEPSSLYDPILEAFDDAIRRERERVCVLSKKGRLYKEMPMRPNPVARQPEAEIEHPGREGLKAEEARSTSEEAAGRGK